MKKSILVVFAYIILIWIAILPIVLATLPYPQLEFQGEPTCKPEENVVEFSLVNNGDASINTDAVSIIVHLYSGEKELNLPSIFGNWDKNSIEVGQSATFTSLGGQFVLRGDYVLQIEHIMLPNNLGYRVIIGYVSCQETSTTIINPSEPSDSSASGRDGGGAGGITGEIVEEIEKCEEGEEKECDSIFTEELIERTGCSPIYKCENGKWSEKCYTVKDCPTAKEDTTPVGQGITGEAISESESKAGKFKFNSSLVIFLVFGVVVIIVGIILVKEFRKKKI